MNCCPCGIINSMFKTERATQDGMLPHPQETETPSRSNDPPRSRTTDGVTVEVKEKKKARRNIFIPEVNKVTVTYFGSEAAVHREQERTENQKQFIIHPYGCFRGYWIVVMLVVTLINVLIIPLGVSFFSEVIQKDALWLAYNVISDSLFIVDLVLNFYTGFISDDKADIVLDLNKIRNHYFKSWFLPDLLAVLPVDYGLLIARSAGLVSTYPSGYTAVRVTRMIKITRLFSLLRLLRFFKLVRYIRIWEEVHMHGIASAIKFFYLIAIIVLLCHWNACLQFLVVLMLDFPDKSWVQVDGLVDKSIGQQYSKAMFRALCHMMTLSYGTTGIPRGLSDIWVVIISMLIGAVMYALLLASLTSVLTNSEASKQVYDIKDVIIYNCQRLVSNMPLFKDTDPNFITAMLDKLQFEMYQTNDVIIRNGALGNRMFFIDRGTVLVESANLMCQLRDGDFFGELCLITGGRRRASVKALTPCRLYSLSVTCYRTVLQLYPEVKNHIEEVAYKRLQTQDGRRLHPQTIPAI